MTRKPPHPTHPVMVEFDGSEIPARDFIRWSKACEEWGDPDDQDFWDKLVWRDMVREWCADNLSAVPIPGTWGAIFFASEADALMFKLRWL